MFIRLLSIVVLAVTVSIVILTIEVSRNTRAILFPVWAVLWGGAFILVLFRANEITRVDD